MKKQLLYHTLFFFIIAAVWYWYLPDSRLSKNEKARRTYEKMLAAHSYKQKKKDVGSAEKEESKKPDRPDEAFMQNFLLTMDPALGYPPVERLYKAYSIIEQLQASQQAMRAATSWTERGPDNVGGRTRALMIDPNDPTHKKVWAGGVGGGLWYCNDYMAATPAWNKVDDFWDNLAISAIAYDPTDVKVFYVGTGEGWYNLDAITGGGIWKTTDGGATWSRLSSTTGAAFSHIQKIVVHPTTGAVYAATRSGGVMRSTDDGASWSKVLGTTAGASTNTVSDLEIGADGTIYAGMGVLYVTGAVYRSSSGDLLSWSKLNTGSNGMPSSAFERVEIATAPGDANVLYVLTQGGGVGLYNIYYSSDKGSSWSTLAKPNDADPGIPDADFTRSQAWYDLIAAVDPNDAASIYVGGVDLFKSTTAGSSWTQVAHWYGGYSYPYVHADQHSIIFSPGSSGTILFGNDGGLFYTSNGTSSTPSFTSLNNGYNVTQFYACALHPDAGSPYALAGSQDNGTQQFSTAGLGSTVSATGGDGGFCFIDQDNPNYQITSYVYNNYYLSTDGGESFFTTLSGDYNGSFINPADYDDRENILYSNYSSTAIQRIKNIGDNPSDPETFSVSLGSEASHIRVSPYSPTSTTTLFVGTEAGRLFRITNAQATPGVTEITGSSFPTGSISCVEIGASESELLATFSNYGVTSVWYSANGGTTWTNKEGNLPDMPVRWAAFSPKDPKQVLLATEAGVWTVGDISVSSPSWSTSISGLAKVRVDMLQKRPSDNTVIAATHGRGLFELQSSGTPVSNFTADESSICADESVAFTDQSTNSPDKWEWKFFGGTPDTSNEQNPVIKYLTPGTYTVQLKTSNAEGEGTTVVKTDLIKVIAKPATSAIAGKDTVCATGTELYSVTFTSGSSYNWTVTGGSKRSGGTSNKITVEWGNSGSGSVSVTETNASGCSGTSVTLNSVINPAPVTSAISGRDSVCGGDEEAYSVANTVGSMYEWLVEGGTISSGNSTSAVKIKWGSADKGKVTVTETSSSGCKGNAISVSVEIAPIPSASFSVDKDTVLLSEGATVNFTNTSANASAYIWNFGDGSSFITAASPSHQYKAVGIYEVTLAAFSSVNCQPDSAKHTIIVNEGEGVSSKLLLNEIRIFPNPASEKLMVETKGVLLKKMDLIDQRGRIVLSISANTTHLEMDTYSIAEGHYLLRIETEKGWAEKKIIIK